MSTGSKSGKLVLATMLVVALGLACFSVWYRYQATRRALEFWGPQPARRIMSAPRVELLALTSASATGEAPQLKFAGGSHWVLDRVDVTDAKGLAHVRKALLEDLSFDWNAPAGCCQPQWPYALQFVEADALTTVLIDPECGLAAQAGGDRAVTISPILHGLKAFLRENTSPAEL